MPVSFHLQVPDALLLAVGRVVVASNALDLNGCNAIGTIFTDHARIGQVVSADLSSRARRELLLNLFAERHGQLDPEWAPLVALMKRADRLEDERNSLVHSNWGAGSVTGVTRVKSKGRGGRGLKVDFDHITVATVGGVGERVCQLTGDFWEFWSRLVRDKKAMLNPNDSFWTDGRAPWSR